MTAPVPERLAEEDLTDLGERGEVVHVVGEVRHERDGRGADARTRTVSMLARSRSAISLNSARLS